MDPYKILGVSQNATDEEIKRAYRRLSRIYHPDANMNNPNKAEAEERFKQIGQAYKLIMNQRSGNYYAQNGGFNGAGETNAYENDAERMLFVSAAAYIRNQRFREAINVLAGISNHNGRWYYFSAIANAGIGNMITANEHIKRAISLEPDNVEYQRAYMQLQQPVEWYSRMENGYAAVPDMDNMCLKLCIANLFCNLCFC